MTKDRKTQFEDIRLEIDNRLGGLLGELGSAVSEALSRLDQGGEVHKETTFDTGKGPIRASAGVRIRTLGDPPSTARKAERPVNTPAPKADPQPPAARPIDATVLVDADSWVLVAELPGIGAEDLSVTLSDGALEIAAQARGRRYFGRFDLPEGLDGTQRDESLQNGILNITVKKADL